MIGLIAPIEEEILFVFPLKQKDWNGKRENGSIFSPKDSLLKKQLHSKKALYIIDFSIIKPLIAIFTNQTFSWMFDSKIRTRFIIFVALTK